MAIRIGLGKTGKNLIAWLHPPSNLLVGILCDLAALQMTLIPTKV